MAPTTSPGLERAPSAAVSAPALSPESTPSWLVCASCGKRFPADYRMCPQDGTLLDASGFVDPLLGRVLGGTYRVLRPLRSGGMGRLYEAEHVRLGRRLALKVVHEVYADHPDAVARFEREARAAARIDSDYVLSVLDVIRAPDGRPAIVAELLDGEDLQARLDREGSLTIGEAVNFARRVALGVTAAHARGVLHRDLKPSNIFLAARPESGATVKILDFGVAKLEGDRDITKSDAVLGTPAYMSPEQARGAAKVGNAVDVYGIGALLYRMLTGVAPYSGSDATATLAKLLDHPPKRVRALRKEVPAGLEAIVERAMAREPALRFESAEALELALRPFDVVDALSERPARGATGVPGTGEDTLAAPRGTIREVERLSREARLVRPRALLQIVLTGTIAGLASAALVASLIEESSTAVQVGAFGVATALVLALGLRSLIGAWSTAPAVRRIAMRLRRINLSFVITLGTLTLLSAARLEAGLLGSEAVRLLAAVIVVCLVVLATSRERALTRAERARRDRGSGRRQSTDGAAAARGCPRADPTGTTGPACR